LSWTWIALLQDGISSTVCNSILKWATVYLPHFTYIEEEKCIIGASYEMVKRLDVASAFETGSLKYKSMIPAITRGDIPDGVLPYVLARGNKLGRPDLNFEVLQGRLDILCNAGSGRPKKRKKVAAAKAEGDPE
jgi:hypothetical protein